MRKYQRHLFRSLKASIRPFSASKSKEVNLLVALLAGSWLNDSLLAKTRAEHVHRNIPSIVSPFREMHRGRSSWRLRLSTQDFGFTYSWLMGDEGLYFL